mgnify:CR=1 FL=1
MDKTDMFNEFLINQSAQIEVTSFLVNLIIAGILSSLIALVYVKFGSSLSNRKRFSNNFLMITMTTMLIITIVKTSLALSLGLVGALSIIRFRTAIKEPEELAFMFISIAVGLGLGAGQRLIVILGLAVILLAYMVKSWNKAKRLNDEKNFYLTISWFKSSKYDLANLLTAVKKTTDKFDLQRLDSSSKDSNEALILIEIDEINDVQSIIKELNKIDSSINTTFFENTGKSF